MNFCRRSESYFAPMSDEVRRILANPETRRELLRGVLSGADSYVAGGVTFRRKWAVTGVLSWPP